MKYITDIYVHKLANKTVEDISADYSFADKKLIMEYFGRFDPSLFTSAPVIDAFTGKKVAEADNGYSDGEYTWYKSEMHYFEHYGLKLCNDFIDHVKSFMDTVQSRIDRMHEGDLAQIIAGIHSSNDLLVMNAILAGANQRITDENFIAGVRKALDNSVCLMNIPISSVATAALHVLKVQKYTGHDPRILQLISSEFDF